MGKEQGTPKRTTRSNSSTTPLRNTPETEKVDGPLAPSSNLLEGPISQDDLFSSLPGRWDQVLEILQLIGPLNSPMLPLFLYGGTSTGKTRAVLQIFRHLDRPFVYVSCRSCHSPCILFESILNQLVSCKRNSANGYMHSKRCERPSEFVDLLRVMLQCRQKDIGKEHLKRSGLKGPNKHENGKMVYFIFDNVELIPQWGKNSSLLSTLFKIHDILRMPGELGLIYISRATPDMYYSHAGSTEPITVYFPDYTEDELYKILMRNQPNPKLYSSFLKVVLKLFFRVTRRLDELSTALKPLFQKYCEPLSDLTITPDVGMKRRLFDNLQPHLAASLDETFKVESKSSATDDRDKSVARKRNLRKPSWGVVTDGIDFHMSVSAKYLLISAFLASRNPATLDAAMFDSTGGPSNQKRKKKSSETSIQLNDNKAQEMLMKGPGSFSLERLLVIFQCITSVIEDTPEEDILGNVIACQEGEVGLMSDVLLQLSGLCNANFITKGGSCPLECSTRYRATIDEEMALKVIGCQEHKLPSVKVLIQEIICKMYQS